jgi:periplasmic divalent cation tolerance protein
MTRPEPDAALIWCPFGDEDSAAKVAGQLLDEGLVACANLFPPMRSLYVWNGERGESTETGVLFKTHPSRLGAAIRRIEALHPYDAPSIAGWYCAAGEAAATWLSGFAA